MLPDPIFVKTLKFNLLRPKYRSAIIRAADEMFSRYSPIQSKVKIERYLLSDLVLLFKYKFNWKCNLSDIVRENDKERIKDIMRLIPQNGQWPYVFFFKTNLKEMINCSEDEWRGDGWHRFVAANALNKKYFEIIYVCRSVDLIKTYELIH